MHPRGVNVFGYISAELGTGEVARLVLRSLHAASVRTAAVDLPLHSSRAQAAIPPADETEPCLSHDLFVVNADQLPMVREVVGPRDGRPLAALWAWESQRLPDGMAASFDGVDRVLTISEHSAVAIRAAAARAGVGIDVHVLPVPIAVPDVSAVSRTDLGLAERGALVVFCFDLLSVIERKNPFAAIEAYRRAVPEPGPGCRLVLKTINGSLRSRDLARLREAAADRRDILVIDEYWSHERTLALIAHADVYLSLHRCEGFGHTVAEAMALGTAVITTGYSGTMEFTTPENAVLVPYRLVDIPDGIAPYSGTGRWAEPDVEVAGAELARLLADHEARAALGARAREIVGARRLDVCGRAVAGALGWPPRPRLTAVVPSSRDWSHADGVVRALGSLASSDVEVIAACAGPEALPPQPVPGVRYLEVTGDDVFAARAQAAAAATGEVVALLEDHSYPGPTWASELLALWDEHPDADALVHTIRISPDAGVFETAVFTLTFGPFIPPLDPARSKRLPVPGIFSIRRSVLPDAALAPGDLEYATVARIVASGRVAYSDALAPVHVQPLDWRALVLCFYSGRSFAGSLDLTTRGWPGREARRLRGDVSTLVRESFDGRRRANGGRIGWRVGAAIVGVIGANMLGQVIGIVTKSVGRSRSHME